MRIAIIVALLVSMLTTVLRAGQPPSHELLGRWRFDAARSSFSGAIPYRSSEISYTQTSLGIHVAQDIVEGIQRNLHFEYLDTRDGRPAKVTGNPFYDHESTRWPDTHTAVRTEYRAGKITGTTTMKVAVGGKTYTATASRTLPGGRTYDSIVVWNRVPD